MSTNITNNSQLKSQSIQEVTAFLQELQEKIKQAHNTENQLMISLYTELLTINSPIIMKAITALERGEEVMVNKGFYDQTPHHFLILPTHHEDVLHLRNKLLDFHDDKWRVRDFGAFGAFDCGFLVIEIDNLEGYHKFKRDICSLIEQGLKYVYPEHIVCWL